MDLALTEDQRLIAETACDFLASACDSSAMRTAAQSADGIDRALWQQIVELGWCGVQVPEEDGGLGGGWVEPVLLVEQLGRRLACVPYFDSIVMAATLLRACAEAGRPWLEHVTSGKCIAATGLNPDHARIQWLADGSLQLHGTWPQFDAAPWADQLIVAARDEDYAPVLVSVAAKDVSIQPLKGIDTTRRSARVHADAVTLPAGNCLLRGGAVAPALRHARDLGAIVLAAEQLGVAQQCLDLTLAYTGERIQFGRPVASFQAVKHRCAQMAVQVETARSAVYGAAAVANADPDVAQLVFHAAQAFTTANDAAQFCTQEAIQLHGGIGYTWECDAQLYFKRAQASSQRLGAPSRWYARVANQLLETMA